MHREDQIREVTKILEGIGLKFAHSVAVALVDRGVGTKDRFEIVVDGNQAERDAFDEIFDENVFIKPIDYKEKK